MWILLSSKLGWEDVKMTRETSAPQGAQAPAAGFIASGPMGGLIHAAGPPSDVLIAHTTLFLHGFSVTPKSGLIEPRDSISIWAVTEESATTAWLAFRLVQDVLSETELARTLYYENTGS